jgi:predicted ATPase
MRGVADPRDREPLGLAGELVWPVPGLAVPERSSSPAELDRYGAVRLFAERAAASKPAFALDPGSAASAAEVCRRLDGMPLAIELAAARVRALSPGEIERRLSDRFALLTGGNRGAAARQQSLRATVDWSHALLGELHGAVVELHGVGHLDLAACGSRGADRDAVEALRRRTRHRLQRPVVHLAARQLAEARAVPLQDQRPRVRVVV